MCNVWGLTNSTYFDLIFVLQKKVLKSITFNDIASPAMPIFRNLELLTLADIHNLQVVSFVYECVNGLSPSYFGDYFKTLSSTHAMGHVRQQWAIYFCKGVIQISMV